MWFLFLIIFGIINIHDYEDVIDYAKTSYKMENVLYYMNIIPDKSPSDEFISPSLFLKRGGGDCDDYALCSATILNIHDYKTKIYILWKYNKENKRWKGHAITWFKKGKDEGYFSNDRRYKTKKPIDKFCKYLGYTKWELMYSTWRSDEEKK